MKKISIMVLAFFVLASVSLAADYMDKSTAVKEMTGGKMFSATLTGNQVVPPVMTHAKGEAAFELGKDGTTLTYKVMVTDLENVTAAHIHLGKKGENGPPIALIKVKASKGKMTGMLANGQITKAELMTSFKGKDVHALISEIDAGNAYVNVHTAKYPDGEIRGQIGK